MSLPFDYLFTGFKERLHDLVIVMGDTYDELDMMLEEPYKTKTSRYDRVSAYVPALIALFIQFRFMQTFALD